MAICAAAARGARRLALDRIRHSGRFYGLRHFELSESPRRGDPVVGLPSSSFRLLLSPPPPPPPPQRGLFSLFFGSSISPILALDFPPPLSSFSSFLSLFPILPAPPSAVIPPPPFSHPLDFY